ncbi:MAG TPA: beta-propeller fold lactonase family protein [Terriglobales bacterium]|nr:beta-propeller fold lactonase family protein [Terriglobales bacterium]
MYSRLSRNSVYLAIAYFGLVLALLFWAGCGGTSASSSSTPSAGNNPSTGGSQPGSGSSGSGGSSGTGGTSAGSGGSGGTSGSSGGSASSGGSGGSGGTGGSNAGASGATFFYVSVATDSARIGGYKVDYNGATLTEVPGSPFNEQGGTTPGVLVVSKKFVFGSEAHISTTSSSNSSAIITSFRPDAASGTLTQVGTLTLPNNGQAALFTEPTGHNLYVIDSSNNILTLVINPDGTLTNTGSSLHLADGISSLAVSPNGQLAYVVAYNGTFTTGFTDELIVLNRDPNSGKLTVNHQVNSKQHLDEVQFDTSGRYLLILSSSSDHMNVYSVDYSTGDATPVPGSPFATTRGTSVPNSSDFTRDFRMDPSGKFLYVLNANAANQKPEYVSVFSFAEATGTLAPVQQFDMPPGTTPVTLVVDPLAVFVVNTNSGFNPSNIDVLRRDANTGMLSAGGSPTIVQRSGLGQAGEVQF